MYKAELKELISLAVAITLSLLMEILIGVTTAAFAGHYLGSTEFAVVGLANSLCNVLGTSIAYGLSSAMDTLGAQSFGSENKMLVGRTLQRGILILGLVLFPCAAMFLNIENIMLLVKTDPAVAALTGRYMSISVVMLPPLFLSTVLERYLQAQDIVYPTLIINVFCVLSNFLVNYLLLVVANFGLDGSAYSSVIVTYSHAILITTFIHCSKVYVPTWPRWSMAALQEWQTFMALGVAGLFMIGVEWWLYEITQILSSYISTKVLAGQVVVYQIVICIYMIPYGISEAAAVRVGNWLGAGNANAAKKAAVICLFINTFVSGSMVGLLYFGRSLLAHLVTNDADIIDLAANTLKYVAIFHAFDSLQCICGGIMRGAGLQKIGVWVNIIGLYLVGLPLVIYLAFIRNLGLEGIWIGVGIGAVVLALVDIFIVMRMDWPEQVRVAIARCAKVESSCLDEAVHDDSEHAKLLTPYDREADNRAENNAVDSPAILDEEMSDSSLLITTPQLSLNLPVPSTFMGIATMNNPQPSINQLRRRRWLLFGFCIFLLTVAVSLRVMIVPPGYCFPTPQLPGSFIDCTSAPVEGACRLICDPGFHSNQSFFYCTANLSWQGLPCIINV